MRKTLADYTEAFATAIVLCCTMLGLLVTLPFFLLVDWLRQ